MRGSLRDLNRRERIVEAGVGYRDREGGSERDLNRRMRIVGAGGAYGDSEGGI